MAPLLPARRSPSSLLASEASVSEVLATVLLTALTVVIAGGFGLVVLSTLDDARDPPTGSFSLDAEPDRTDVLVRFVAGTSFRLDATDVVLLVDGNRVDGTQTLVDPATPGVFAPGGVLRIDLAVGPPENARLMLLVVDRETGRPVGTTVATLVDEPAPSSFLASVPSLGTVALSASTLTVDGATPVNLSVHVSSTFGLDLVRSVTVNLSRVGGGHQVALLDDGRAPDLVAADGIYTAALVALGHDFVTVPGLETVALPVRVEDVFGHVATADALVTLESSPLSKVGIGAKYRPIPASGRLDYLNLTDLVLRDPSVLTNDQVELRVTDLEGTGAWTALVSFASPSDCGGALPGVTSIRLTRTGVAGDTTYTPTPGPCFSVGALSEINVAEPDASLDASGATGAWSVAGTPSVHLYGNAGIGPDNEATITFFGDAVSPAPSALGLAHANLTWGRIAGNAAPLASFSTSASLTSLTASVDASSSLDPEGGALTYLWAWGDGATTGPQPSPLASHAYATGNAYTITLTVTDQLGATASTTRTVTVNRAPVASFTASTTALRVDVDSSGSSDPDGDALTRAWEWGDGATQSGGVTASHTYALPGSYVVRLTVTDVRGVTHATTSTVTVSLSNVAPTASFAVTSTAGLVVNVDGSASSDLDGSIASYSWEWGDGSTSVTAGPLASHAYPVGGVYALNLTVTDNGGATSAKVGASVTPNRAPVVTSLSATTLQERNATLATVASDPDGHALTYAYAWGDGTNASLRGSDPVALHAYARPGNHTVTVFVNDSLGASTSTTLVVSATAAHYAMLNVTDAGTPAGALADGARIHAVDGSTATLTEATGAGASYTRGVACDRTFDGCTGTSTWALLSGSFQPPAISTPGSSLGTSGAALDLRNNGGAASLQPATYRMTWTQTANPVAGAGTFTMGYRFGTATAGQNANVLLVAPSGAKVNLGTTSTVPTVWTSFTGASIPAGFLAENGTYSAFFNVTVEKNKDLYLDDVTFAWADSPAYRLQKEWTFTGLPVGADLSHHLEVVARQDAVPETLLIQVQDSTGAWTTRGQVTGATLATHVHKLTAPELQGDMVRIRLVDVAASDASQSSWALDAIRIVVRGGSP